MPEGECQPTRPEDSHDDSCCGALVGRHRGPVHNPALGTNAPHHHDCARRSESGPLPTGACETANLDCREECGSHAEESNVADRATDAVREAPLPRGDERDACTARGKDEGDHTNCLEEEEGKGGEGGEGSWGRYAMARR